MTTEDAKLILQAYPPGKREPLDPALEEALTLAERDPELREWFAEQQALDAAIAKKLRQLPVPAEVANRVIADKGFTRPQAPLRQKLYWGLAASLVALLVVWGTIWFGKSDAEPSFANYRKDMTEMLAEFPRLDLETDKLSDIREWLRTQGWEDAEIPVALQKFPSIGCRAVEWRGRRSALVCFAVEGEVVHLLILEKSGLSDAPAQAAVQFRRVGRWSTASWSADTATYLTLTKGSEEFLKRHLPKASPVG